MSVFPRKQIPVTYAADCDIIARYGGAKLVDKYEIIGWLKYREQRCVG